MGACLLKTGMEQKKIELVKRYQWGEGGHVSSAKIQIFAAFFLVGASLSY